MNDLSLCNACNCMTHTIDGYCGKCKESKQALLETTVTQQLRAVIGKEK